MFPYVISFFIFCLVLFLYLHIYFHLKTSDDLEIYEMDTFTKEKMEEICDMRQPLLFYLGEIGEKLKETTSHAILSQNYHAFDMKVRDNRESTQGEDTTLYIPLPYQKTMQLLEEDTKSSYFSEKNEEFLSETGIQKQLQYQDAFLRPYLVSQCNYDLIVGSENTTTPLRYDIHYRNYFFVTKGTIKVKLTPPKYGKFLHTIKDYENFEFRSPVPAWDPPENTIYKQDFDKIKFLEIEMREGQVLFIPAYWWYSIRFSKKATVLNLQYKTYMNSLAVVPHYVLYLLQMQNIKRQTVELTPITELNESEESKESKESNKKYL